MKPMTTGDAIKAGFWAAAGAAAFWGLIYLTGAGLALIGAGASKPAQPAKKPCGCGCGG
jgi:hypothetical protein